jgi:outer membrane receptor protein involved in Fe transport
MIDQPNDIVNASIGYDYNNFSIRVSMLYQSNIFSGVNYWEELRSYTSDYLRFDLSARYKIAAVDGLQVFMNLANFNNAKDIVVVKGNKNPTSIQHYGMVVDLGVRMRF